MPQMPFPKILAFVEGSMEQLFINNSFSYAHVIQVSNGVGWSVPALSEQIATFYKARDPNVDAIVVWVDREKRQECGSHIEDAIRSALVSAGAAPEKIHILVADRMTENIILADEEFIKGFFGLDDYKYEFEGAGGKHKLKMLYQAQGKNYKETLHGVAALKKIRLANCRSNSPSVDRLLATLDLPCWWIEARPQGQ